MKLGMFMQPVHKTERDVHRTLLEDVEIGVHCGAVGMDEFWVGEHYTNKTQNVTSAAVFLANLIARTDKMLLGAGVVPMPSANPGYVAAQIALLDHLSAGRLIVGLGIGACPTDFEMYKAVELYPMLKEGVRQTIALWTQPQAPFHVSGAYWDFAVGEERRWPEYGIGEMLEPYQKPHPPVAIPCISPNSESVRFAGENGFIPITAQLSPAWVVADHWKCYGEGSARTGRTPDPASWRVARAIYVDKSDAAAEDVINGEGNPFDFYYRYVDDVLKAAGYAKIIVPEPEMVDTPAQDNYGWRDYKRDNLMYGGPDTVFEKLLAFCQAAPPFGTLLMTSFEYGGARDKILDSISLMANEVMPRLRHALGERAAAR